MHKEFKVCLYFICVIWLAHKIALKSCPFLLIKRNEKTFSQIRAHNGGNINGYKHAYGTVNLRNHCYDIDIREFDC